MNTRIGRRFHLRIPVAAATVLALTLAPVATSAATYALSRATEAAEADLRLIEQFADIVYRRFDVEIDQDFCIRVGVEVTARGHTDVQPQGGHCSRAGHHRLMVALGSPEERSVVVRTALHDSTGMGGSMGTRPIEVRPGGRAAREIRGPDGELPSLAEGESTVIAAYEYGRGDDVVGIRLLAELLPNPTGAISSGGLPVSIGKRD